jgi:hypothetical protein
MKKMLLLGLFLSNTTGIKGMEYLNKYGHSDTTLFFSLPRPEHINNATLVLPEIPLETITQELLQVGLEKARLDNVYEWLKINTVEYRINPTDYRLIDFSVCPVLYVTTKINIQQDEPLTQKIKKRIDQIVAQNNSTTLQKGVATLFNPANNWIDSGTRYYPIQLNSSWYWCVSMIYDRKRVKEIADAVWFKQEMIRIASRNCCR